MSRPSKDKYYLDLAKTIGQRSNCYRSKLGAIIIRDDQIVATGYIGAPRQTKDCLERNNCLRDKMEIPHGQRYEICRSVHAEQNAIINAARAGVSILGGDIYISGEGKDKEPINAFPCYICKKMIINAGLKRAICSTQENEIKIFLIKDWTKEWQENDIVDDKYQYGQERNN
jgi:dCMP deaminase